MRGGSIGEGASSTISANGVQRSVYLGRNPHNVMSLRAAGHTQLLAAFIINVQSFSISALNAICLNSFRIKSAQSSGRRREQKYGGIA